MTTALRHDRASRDDLAARRDLRKRIMAASAERQGRRRVARPKPPNGIVTSYTQTLVAVSRAMDDAIMSELRKAGAIRRDAAASLRSDEWYYAYRTATERTDAAGDGNAPDPDAFDLSRLDIAKLTKAIERRLGAIASRANLVGMIDKIASRAVAYSRDEWRAQLKSALGIDLTADPDLAPLVDRFRRRQTTLITSLAKDKVERVATVLRDAGSDTRVEQVQARIVEQTGATESRAALIARTETVTFNSQLTQARHESAGITEFEVSTSRDERVRPSHAALEGRRFSYADPPIVDGEAWIPGQTFNCRCTCIPVLPGIDDV